MKNLTATHVLLSLVIVALIANVVVMLQAPVQAGALADDLSDVVREMDEMNYTLKSIASELDGIERRVTDIAEADIFDLRTSSSSATTGLPVVVVGD